MGRLDGFSILDCIEDGMVFNPERLGTIDRAREDDDIPTLPVVVTGCVGRCGLGVATEILPVGDFDVLTNVSKVLDGRR